MACLRPTMLLLACVLGLSACNRASEDKAFDDKVHAYLVNHPEVLQEVETKLQAKQQDEALAQAKPLIERNRAALERDPADYVANPGGRITVTEFYDYRCPHCVNMAPEVLSMIHDDPDVRFVFKEFPIFGPVSEKAAAGALTVKQNGGDYLGLYKDFMAQKGLNESEIDQILRAHGVDPDNLSRPDVARQTSAHLSAVKQLAVALNIEGTPTFVIGDTMIPGEDPDGLKAAIAAARAGKS